ncbi:MAG TPA: ABC transporter substrate-binding protein [Actinophytocola sp.]|nr:ABC transporter substrate-binding protein [Actinophytocola sp.]
MRRVVTLLVIGMVVAGCGVFDARDAREPKLTPVTVSVLPVMDTAPLWTAAERGYFADEGLAVTTLTAGSANDTISLVVNGEADLGYSSYQAGFSAQAHGAAGGFGRGQVRVVADGYAAGPGTFAILSRPLSGIDSPADLAGRRVALSTPGSIVEYACRSALADAGVDLTTIQWTQVAFPQMVSTLRGRGGVDGAVLVEPYLTEARLELDGLAALAVDCAAGPNAGIPLGGYFSTAGFAAEHPTTVAAFRRALARGVDDLQQNRALLNEIVTDPAHVQVSTNEAMSTDLAHELTPGVFRTELDEPGLERVARLMKDYAPNFPADFDVRSMLVVRNP